MAVMERFAALCVVLAVTLGFASPALAQATRGVSITEVTEDRLAIVIGNAAYRFSPLDNPVNDARLMSGLLEKAGFKVFKYENLDRNGLFKALRDFGDRLNDRTIAVFYYAGHALQLRDRNFLVPVEAEIRNEDEIEMAGVDVGFVLARMSSAKSRINIVILDACRNNPFAGKTRPDARPCADGCAGRHAARVRHRTRQGLRRQPGPERAEQPLYRAPGQAPADARLAGRDRVQARARGGGARDQWRPGAVGELVAARRVRVRAGPAQSSKSLAADESAGELAFWNSIQSSTRADEYRAYLRQYPGGRFAALAQTRIAASGRRRPRPRCRTVRTDPSVGGCKPAAARG